MNEIIVEATGLPLRFPDPREEAYARSQVFQRLPPDKRLEAILDTIAMGMFLLSQSPQRPLLDALFLKREAEWQRIQQELFVHGK